MKVLVIGASGFIGLAVAQALCRAGHTVYGLTRSTQKAKQLAADEITPIVGEITSPASWIGLVATMDVIIEALGGTANLRTGSVALLEAVVEAVKRSRPPSAPRLSYIYTSGTWVHGESPNDFISDTTPITNPVQLVAWRPEVEQRVMQEPAVNGIVIRPALLYGKSGSLLASLFEEASKGKVQWYGKPGGRFSLIHPDDLADIYVRVAEKAQILRYLVIDAANDYTESVDDVLQKLVEISGAKGPHEYIPPSNLFETALATTTLLRPYLAKTLLGWRQKKQGLLEGLPSYYSAWQASQDGQQGKDKLTLT